MEQHLVPARRHHPLRRREFVAMLAAAAAVRASIAFAQDHGRTRRIGVLMPIAESDPEAEDLGAPFRARLQELGWTGGRNLHIDYRWAGGDADRIRTYASELVALGPDVILAGGAPVVAPLERATQTIPIVFVAVSDPVSQGFVADMAHPGGNVTGFTNFAPSMGGKWLALLKEMAPRTSHVGVLYNPRTAPYTDRFMHSVAAAAPGLSVTARAVAAADEDGIETGIAGIARTANGGLLVPSDAFTLAHYGAVVAAAARHGVPAIYGFRVFAENGGLASWGVDLHDEMRQAASYIDRILSGTSPGDLPVQEPSAFQLVVNAKTAKALGLTLPPALLARADEVIE